MSSPGRLRQSRRGRDARRDSWASTSLGHMRGDHRPKHSTAIELSDDRGDDVHYATSPHCGEAHSMLLELEGMAFNVLVRKDHRTAGSVLGCFLSREEEDTACICPSPFFISVASPMAKRWPSASSYAGTEAGAYSRSLLLWNIRRVKPSASTRIRSNILPAMKVLAKH